MQINPTDILVRPNAYEMASVWISQDLLLRLLPTLGKSYLDVKARPQYKDSVQPCFRSKDFLPDTQKAWRYGRQNGTFYYAYDNIPDKAPKFYGSSLPTRKELLALRQAAQKEQVATPLEALIEPYLNQHYRNYLPHYGDCTKQQQINLAKAAAFIEATIASMSQQNMEHKAEQSAFHRIAEMVARFDIKYVPKHPRNIKGLIEQIQSGIAITERIKLPRAGNKNAAVHCSDEEIKSWILLMRESGRNFTNSYIIRKLQWMCTATDKPMPSERWIGQQMEEANMKFLSAAGRFGSKGRHGHAQRGYTPFANALYAGDCWQVDGSRFNIIDFKIRVTEDGKEVNKNVFLYIVAVRDVHSGDILGYSFNLAENRWTYIQALKMAVEEAGYLPYEIVFDRFPGHNTEEAKAFFEDLENRGVRVSFVHTAQGKAKVERWFRTLQEVFMQDSDYYYGEGIQSRNLYAHRSKEYLKEIRSKAKQQGWNYDAACDEAAKIIEAYRSTSLSHYSRKFKTYTQSPAQLHSESEKPNVINLEDHQLVYLFGLRRKAKISNMGLIDFEMQGVMFNYRCEDYDVVSNTDYVTIAYDLEDMTRIHLYEISDRPLKKYLGTANEIDDIIPYGPEAFKGYGKQAAIIRQLEDFRQQELEYKKAVGYDSIAILESGSRNKYEYESADAAATFKHVMGGDDSNMDGYNMHDQL